jgi:hypothetical protein
MFLERLFTASKSIFSRTQPKADQNAQASVILQRVRELMELAPSTPIASCAGEINATFELPNGSVAGSDIYGERAYAEDPH